ncbi:MAG TPA: HAMP domain-containing protein, partial [Anaerolineae bacterium]|nr:HAMP domain-containing protein [Anaerolineae bacterium]
MSKRFVPPLAFALGIGAVLITALIAIQVILAPPPEDLRLLLGYMLLTSLGSLGAGYILYRLDWWRWPRRIFYTFLLGLFFQSGVVFFNVWLTARSMLINEHDLEVTYVLLLFGIAVGIVFGVYAARVLTLRIRELHYAAQRIAGGDLSTRVIVKGRDELADLSTTFNRMITQLEKTDRQQRELDKLRRDLIAGASHDLRTPITSMRVVIEALADGLVEDPDSRQHYLASLQADIASLSKMIDELFELAQIDAGGLKLERGPTALRDLISDVMVRLRPLARAHQVQLDGDVAADVDPVTLDAAKMERVLVNLINNALRHTSA